MGLMFYILCFLVKIKSEKIPSREFLRKKTLAKYQ